MYICLYISMYIIYIHQCEFVCLCVWWVERERKRDKGYTDREAERRK